MFLGCTLENPRYTSVGRKPFNPDDVPECVNALGPNKDIKIENMMSLEYTEGSYQPTTDNTFTFRVRERHRTDQLKSLVQGQD